MADNTRIEDLRRRVEADPASIAFASLAEEYRRSGAYQDAIDTCRTGLQRHPSYLSARVTLGRALIEVGDYDAARQELDTVLKSAPENLAAIRALADIQERSGQAPAPPAAVPPKPVIPVNTPAPAKAAAPVRPVVPVSTAAPATSVPSVESSAPVEAPRPNPSVVTRLDALLGAIQAARASDRRER